MRFPLLLIITAILTSDSEEENLLEIPPARNGSHFLYTELILSKKLTSRIEEQSNELDVQIESV